MNQEVVLQVGVKVFLRNAEGKYLLIRRSAKVYPEIENRWDIIGGRINPGVPLFENLQREVREETGLQIKGTVVLLTAQDILANEGKHVVRLTYLGEAQSSTVQLDEQENDKYVWVTVDELLKYPQLNPYTAQALKDAKLVKKLKTVL